MDHDEPAPELAGLAAVWSVIHARPRCEKKLADYCRRQGVEHYLPLRVEHKVYQRRKVEVWKPLFPGYVFACFAAEQRLLIMRSSQVARLLPVRDQARLIAEMDQIRLALAKEPGLSACAAVKRGTRVRILKGPFQGLEGVVSTLKGQTRVVLNVDIIAQAVAVEVSRDMLEPV
ncbi:MAG: UpxY family transcription antiterminator [Lentisphaerae bacterium]|nr:UpxY family transcription antiterminator [Lentisphaerota bacterium]